MRPTARHQRFGAVRRPGFTVTEILVVISIIAVLAALTTAGISWAIGGRHNSNAQDAVRTIAKTVDQHWAHVVNEAKKEVGIPSAVVTLADGNMERAKVIWVKLRLMEAFPTTFAEVSNP